jgi:hypothetical protein
MKKLLTILTLLFVLNFALKTSAFATGLPVFDATSAAHAITELNSLQQMIQHNTEMAKKVGDGEFTPATINWMNSWYAKCGGGKFVLPDWFPHPKIDICADSNKTLEIAMRWYEKEFLISTADTPEVARVKGKKEQKAQVLVRGWGLAKSSIEMQRAEEDAKAIENLQGGLKGATDQIQVQKVQTQVLIQILAELQKINMKQSELMHIISIR